MSRWSSLLSWMRKALLLRWLMPSDARWIADTAWSHLRAESRRIEPAAQLPVETEEGIHQILPSTRLHVCLDRETFRRAMRRKGPSELEEEIASRLAALQRDNADLYSWQGGSPPEIRVELAAELAPGSGPTVQAAKKAEACTSSQVVVGWLRAVDESAPHPVHAGLGEVLLTGFSSPLVTLADGHGHCCFTAGEGTRIGLAGGDPGSEVWLADGDRVEVTAGGVSIELDFAEQPRRPTLVAEGGQERNEAPAPKELRFAGFAAPISALPLRFEVGPNRGTADVVCELPESIELELLPAAPHPAVRILRGSAWTENAGSLRELRPGDPAITVDGGLDLSLRVIRARVQSKGNEIRLTLPAVRVAHEAERLRPLEPSFIREIRLKRFGVPDVEGFAHCLAGSSRGRVRAS
jgi:hypothetical protein